MTRWASHISKYFYDFGQNRAPSSIENFAIIDVLGGIIEVLESIPSMDISNNASKWWIPEEFAPSLLLETNTFGYLKSIWLSIQIYPTAVYSIKATVYDLERFKS